MTTKQAKVLVNTLGSSQREVDVETLNNTLSDTQALLRLRHYLTC